MTACASGGTDRDAGDRPPAGPSVLVSAREEVPESLRQSLAQAASSDGTRLAAAHPSPAPEPLGYDPTAATGMELIQSSALALSEGELAVLAQEGLVISKAQQFPSFAYGYKTIYSQDLPLYVSADSLLEAVHRTFDTLLKQTEEQVLVAELEQLLAGMRANLPTTLADPALAGDADLYLTVASSLLAGAESAPVASGDLALASELFQRATEASGHKSIELFGVPRDLDFSQFKPRGHYADSEALQRYFRAMMWLGRIDLRLIETQLDGTQRFYRRQFDAAVALRELMGQRELERWQRLDATLGAYAGERDSMTVDTLDGLMTALSVASLEEAATLTDEAIVAEIARGGWGAQRIASRLIEVAADAEQPLPLDRSFLLFGQRYTVDSHTFVNVTYDRVDGRLMPQPLDVAFAALANPAALPLLASDLENTSYAQGLAKTRTLVDAHEDTYWEGSLYTRWLGALRSLSPAEGVALAGVSETPGWQARVLQTQLGSWAELRHDTILYVKQSYTAGATCEFPDAYVDPYPEFYAKLGALADAVATVTASLPEQAAGLKNKTEAWASNFQAVASNLEQMARDQLTGSPHSQELVDFINDAVAWNEDPGCGGVASYSELAGWYLRLYLDEQAGLEYDPTVADVHTQPTDAGGNDVGRILHVGTGRPRLMVVTAETCEGPRAYAGLAFSYGELITEDWLRLNDNDWASRIAQEPFPDAPWLAGVLGE